MRPSKEGGLESSDDWSSGGNPPLDGEEIRSCNQPTVSRLSLTERKNKNLFVVAVSRQTHATKGFPLYVHGISPEGFSRNWC